MAEQEFLASFAVEIDESGINRLQSALSENRQLAEELASAFDRAREAVLSFFSSFSSFPFLKTGNTYAGDSEESAGVSLPVSLDLAKAEKEMAAFLKEAQKPFKLTADTSSVVSAGRNALRTLQSLFASSVLPLKVQVQASGGVENTSASVKISQGTPPV